MQTVIHLFLVVALVLVANIAASLSQVSRQDVIDRSIAHFRQADPDYGKRLEPAVAARLSKR